MQVCKQFKQRLIPTLVQGSCYATLLLHFAQPLPALAEQTGAQVVGGTGTITQSGVNTTINQTTQNMAINWQTYNVNANERVQYIQPNASSISLNRILSNNGSIIAGRIDANGQVILVNPNGVFFTPTAVLNVGSLIASGLDIKPTDFMNGNYIFNEVLGTDGAVINSGIINASLGGNVALVGRHVENNGLISANLGTVTLAAGKEAVLTFDTAGLLGVRVSKAILQSELGVDPAVLNSGTLEASGGKVLLTASVSQDIFSQAVNTNGIQPATSVVVNPDGTFTLGAGADVVNTGSIDTSTTTPDQNVGRIVLIGDNVTSSGTLKADALNGNGGEIELHSSNMTLLTQNSVTSARSVSNGSGGIVKVLGDKVGLFDHAVVDVSGANGGGQALIGGDNQGKNAAIQNASRTFVSAGSNIYADALQQGNGGKIINWSNDYTWFYGNAFARGGSVAGNGGFVEISGSGLTFAGGVDTSAVNGAVGTLLFDPTNISILAGNVATTDTLSTTGTTSTLSATTAGAGMLTIDQNNLQAISNTTNIVLQANNNITVEQLVNGGGFSTTLALSTIVGHSVTFTADADNSGAGNFTMLDTTNTIQTQGGSVSISGVNLTVGNIITTGAGNSAGGAITLATSLNSAAGTISVGNLTTNGGTAANQVGLKAGDITISAPGLVSIAGAISANGSNGERNGTTSYAGGAGGKVDIRSTADTVAVNAISANGGAANGTGGGTSANGGAAGTVTLNGQTGVTLSNNINVTGGNLVNGGSDGAGGTVTITGPATLGSNITIDASGNNSNPGTTGDITFSNTITGANNLILTGQDILFSGVIGTAGTHIGALNITAGGAVSAVTNAINATSLTSNSTLAFASGAINTSGAADTAGGNVGITASGINIASINTSGGTASAAAGRNGGTVSLDASTSINVGTITTRGSAAVTGNGGNAGTINLGATTTPTAVILNGDIIATGGVAGTAGTTGSSQIAQVSVNGTATIAYLGNFTSEVHITGTGTADTLVAANRINDWSISGANSGSLNSATFPTQLPGVTFSSIENLTGGSSTNDTFTFGTAGSLSGSTGINGNGGADTLVGRDTTGVIANNWNITGPNSGTLSQAATQYTRFTQINNLTGGSGDDNFNFTAATSAISGIIDGGTGVGINTLSLAGRNGANTFTVASTGNNVRVSIVGTNIVNNFSNIQNLTGGAGDDTFELGLNMGTIDGGTNGNDVFNINASGLTITSLVGGTGGTDTLRGPAAENYWTVTNATGGGTLDQNAGAGGSPNITFAGMETLTGGLATGTDINHFTVNATASINTLNGVGGNDIFLINGSVVTANGGAGDDAFTLGLTGAVTGSGTGLGLIGGAGTNTLTGRDANNTWTISGPNSGSLSDTGGQYVASFSQIQNLNGSAVYTDDFNFTAATSAISGIIDGGTGVGINTLSLAGRNGTNTFTVASSGNDVRVSNATTANIVFSFTNIQNLTGGSGNDTFELSANMGTIDGGTGGNDVFNINASGLTITNLVGGTGGTDTLRGPDAVNYWTVTNASGGGTLDQNAGVGGNPNIAFSGMETLTGGPATGTLLPGGAIASGTNVNHFTVNSGASITTLNGVGGNDTFAINGSVVTANGDAGDDSFNLGTSGTVTGTGVNGLIGGLGTNTLTGPNTAASATTTWSITGSDSGSINTTTAPYVARFVQIQNLNGGAGIDNFNFTLSGAITGTINGDSTGAATSGINTISLSGLSSDYTWTIAAANNVETTTNPVSIVADFNNIQTLTGSLTGADRFDITTAFSGTINGGNGTNRFNIGATIIGSVNGGTGNDSFYITAPFISVMSGSLVGGSGSDTLYGSSANPYNIWTVGSNGGGMLQSSPDGTTITGTINFSGMTNLTGGTGVDNFIFNAATSSLAGLITGGTGADTLVLTGSSIATVQLFNATTTNPSAAANLNVFQVGSITGNGAAASTLISPTATQNTWSLDATGYTLQFGTFSVGFSNFTNLQGGSTLAATAILPNLSIINPGERFTVNTAAVTTNIIAGDSPFTLVSVNTGGSIGTITASGAGTNTINVGVGGTSTAITAGNGTNNVTVAGSSGAITAGSGTNGVDVTGAVTGAVTLGLGTSDGVATVHVYTGGSVSGAITTGSNADSIIIEGTGTALSVSTGAGSDSITIENSNSITSSDPVTGIDGGTNPILFGDSLTINAANTTVYTNTLRTGLLNTIKYLGIENKISTNGTLDYSTTIGNQIIDLNTNSGFATVIGNPNYVMTLIGRNGTTSYWYVGLVPGVTIPIGSAGVNDGLNDGMVVFGTRAINFIDFNHLVGGGIAGTPSTNYFFITNATTTIPNGFPASVTALPTNGAFNGTLDGGTGTGTTNTLTARDTVNDWNLNAARGGNILYTTPVGNTSASYTTNFTGMQNIAGGADSDRFAFTAATAVGSFTTINGGGQATGMDVVDFSALPAATLISVQLGGATYTGIEGYIGNGTNSTLTGATAANTWNISDNLTLTTAGTTAGVTSNTPTNYPAANNSGTVSGTTFINFANLTGGSGAGASDTFDFTNVAANSTSGLVTGTITGGSGTNTLIGRVDNSTWVVNGNNSGFVVTNIGATATRYINNFTGIQNLTGGSSATGSDIFDFSTNNAGVISGTITGGAGSNTLKGRSNNSTWLINAANEGSVRDDTGTPAIYITKFTGIQNLTGGAGDDTFQITASGTVTGGINGGTQTLYDFLDLSSVTGFSYTIGSAITIPGGGTVTGIEGLVGAGAASTLTGVATGGTWAIRDVDGIGTRFDGVNDGTVISGGTTFYFVNFATLVGGAGADNFTVDATGSMTGSINGGAGVANSLTGRNGVNFWTIDALANTSSIKATSNTAQPYVTFSNIQQLVGGSANDTFGFSVTPTVSGVTAVNGGTLGATINEVNVSQVTGNVDVSLNLFTNINQYVGNNTGAASSANNSTLLGTTATTSWNINSQNGGCINSGSATSCTGAPILFSNFNNLTGGTGTNTFNLNNITNASTGSLSGLLTGGGAASLVVNTTGLTTVQVYDTQPTQVVNSPGFIAVFNMGGTISGTNFITATLCTGVCAYIIDGHNTYSLLGTHYTNSSIQGSAGDDTFLWQAGFLDGFINGVSGNDRLVITNLANSTVVLGGTTGASNVMSVQNVQTVIANNNLSNTLIGPNSIINTNFWDIHSVSIDTSVYPSNSGTVTTAGSIVTFANFNNLTGGTGMDNFTLAIGGSLTGLLNGGGGLGADTLVITNQSSTTVQLVDAVPVPQVVNQANNLTVFQVGTITGNATGGTDTLVGSSASLNIWTLNGANSGNVNDGTNPATSFSNFANLLGGTGNDRFDIARDINAPTNAQFNGTIHTNGGADTLNVYLSGLETGVAAVNFITDSGSTATVHIQDATTNSGAYTGIYTTGVPVGNTTGDQFVYTYGANQYTVKYAGAQTVQDTVTANSLMVNGTGNPDLMALSMSAGFDAAFSVNASVTVNVANKNNLILDGLAGADTIALSGTAAITLPTTSTLTLSAETVTQTASRLLVGSLVLNGVATAPAPLNIDVTNLSINNSGNLMINDPNALALGVANNIFSTAGSLDITAGGNVTTNSPLTISGALTIRTPGNITLNNTVATNLASINAANFTVISGGDITDSGAILVTDTTDLTAGVNNITLDNANNNFNVVNVASANAVVLNDVNNIAGGTMTANSINLRTVTGIGALTTQTAILDVINTTSGGVTINNTGNVQVTNLQNYGPITFTNAAGDVTIDQINANFGRDYTIDTTSPYGGTDGAGNGLGVVTMTLTGTGSVYGLGPDFTSPPPEVVAESLHVRIENGVFGLPQRPINVRVRSVFSLSAQSGSVFYFLGPPLVTPTGTSLSVFNGLEGLNGQQLIGVESLAEVDPAIFTEVRNYFYEDIAIKMPPDQQYAEDDEKEKKKRLNEVVNP